MTSEEGGGGWIYKLDVKYNCGQRNPFSDNPVMWIPEVISLIDRKMWVQGGLDFKEGLKKLAITEDQNDTLHNLCDGKFGL